MPPIPGLDQVGYLTNSSMLDLDILPDHLVVVGGSYVGLEFAQMYRRFGSEVTVIEAAPRLIPREDEEISSAVQQILESEGSRVGWRSRYACRGRRRRLQPEVRTRFRCGGVGRLASASRCRATTQHGRSRARAGGGRDGQPGLYHGRRSVAHDPAWNLGARRLQRQGRFHAHLVQRFRDRRRQPARQRIPQRARPYPCLRAVHGSATRTRRHDGGRGAQGGTTSARWKDADVRCRAGRSRRGRPRA